MTGWNWHLDGWIVLAGVLSACSCALLGNYLVLRRMSLMGDAISHAVLPGLAIAFLVTHSRSAMPMFAGAVIAGVVTAVLSQAVNRHGKVEHGAAMGVVFSVLFALGLILIRQAADHVDLDPGCVLYGNIAQIPLEAIGGRVPPQVVNLAVVLVVDVLFVVLFYKELKISTFDPELATTLGYNADTLHYALMVLVSVTTVANFESVGSILVIAMLIVPAVTAHLLTDRLSAMIGVSLMAACLSAIGGHVFAAFGPGWLGMKAATNTSAMMAVVAGLLLCAAVLLAPRHGLVSRLLHRRQMRMTILREDILGLLHRWQEMRAEGGRAMTHREVLAAVGDTRSVRQAIRSLLRNQCVEKASGPPDAGHTYRLSGDGQARAARLIRSHRLWESYIDRHFNLPPDHVHMSAERVEHFLTPELRHEIEADLTSPRTDPHGREIPPESIGG